MAPVCGNNWIHTMQSVRSVAIVGSGSAGWLTALVLNTYCPFLKIRLIRPRANMPIGVGESTQADLLRLLIAARIDPAEFFQACDATMKCGIHYEDWNAPDSHYWHPFSDLALSASYTPAHHYLQRVMAEPQRYSHERYYETVHTSYETCVRRRQVAPESAAAFHVDALKLTQYLERILTRVEVLEADAPRVHSERGRVSGITLDGGHEVQADLYIDCTGFNRALFQQVAEPDFMAYEANVNRVVTAQLPYVDIEKEVTPYTRAYAHEFGWTWSIPLQSRIGTGYVYHGDFCSREEAERNFRRYWGEERMRDIEVRHIAFDSKTLRNPWVSNVVTIGLSAGFVEPLEATGLNWIITSAQVLSQALSVRCYDADTSAKYNVNMLGYIFDVHDFIDAHYKLSGRRDSEFWRYQSHRPFPERLEHRLDLYAEEMPNDANRLKTSPWAFNEISWLDILNGYRFQFRKLDIHPRQAEMAQRQLEEIAATPRQGIAPLNCLPTPGGVRIVS